MIKIFDFTRGGINSSGDYDDVRILRSDFTELQPGTMKIQGVPKFVSKNYDKNLNNYRYSDYTGDTTCYAYLYDGQRAFIASFSAKNGVDISAYTWAEYIRFTVSIGTPALYPNDSHDTTSFYYFLESFDFQSEVVFWNMDENGVIFNPESPPVPEKTMSKPYPAALWRIDPKISDIPYHKLMPLEIPAGAFMGAKNLEYARIPETVRKIGRYAFTDTALKNVRIPPECEYYETSFPENCEIEFYGNFFNKYSGQLYDSESNILIDADGARIYVKE